MTTATVLPVTAPARIHPVWHGLTVLARLGVGLMFAYLSLMKLRDPVEFLKQIHVYNLAPTEPALLVNMLAVTLPWLELLCAAAVLLGVGRRGGALLIALMLLFFTPLILHRGLTLYGAPGASYASFCAVSFDCGCGTGVVFVCRKLAENCALLAGALYLIFARSRCLSLAALWSRRPSAPARAER